MRLLDNRNLLTVASQAHMCRVCSGGENMNALNVIFWVVKIAGALASLGFTYIQYRDYKKKRKEKGSPDAGTSDKPNDDC